MKYIVSNVRLNAARDFGYADNANNKHFKPSAPLSAKDYVYTLVNCPLHKFQKRWRGPYKINKVINDHLCVVELDGGVNKLFNITKLKSYQVSKYSPPRILTEGGNKTTQAPDVRTNVPHDVKQSSQNVLLPAVDDLDVRKSSRQKISPPRILTEGGNKTTQAPDVRTNVPHDVKQSSQNVLLPAVDDLDVRKSSRQKKPKTFYHAG